MSDQNDPSLDELVAAVTAAAEVKPTKEALMGLLVKEPALRWLLFGASCISSLSAALFVQHHYPQALPPDWVTYPLGVVAAVLFLLFLRERDRHAKVVKRAHEVFVQTVTKKSQEVVQANYTALGQQQIALQLAPWTPKKVEDDLEIILQCISFWPADKMGNLPTALLVWRVVAVAPILRAVIIQGHCAFHTLPFAAQSVRKIAIPRTELDLGSRLTVQRITLATEVFHDLHTAFKEAQAIGVKCDIERKIETTVHGILPPKIADIRDAVFEVPSELRK